MDRIKAEETARSLMNKGWTWAQPVINITRFGTQVSFQWPNPVAAEQDFADLREQYNPESLFIEADENGKLFFLMFWPSPQQ